MLNTDQYASSVKYEARIHLHTKFRVNPGSKFKWIFRQFPSGEKLNVLELGCGTGLFWLANRDEIPAGWTITLTDYSEGMLDTARRSLSRLGPRFRFEKADAGKLSYPDMEFDIILANNMLYHIENRAEVISQIAGILKNNGKFFASTMGSRDLMELNQILYDFLSTRGKNFRFRELPFSLENGLAQLEASFGDVTLLRYDDMLKIDEADPVINYYLSFNGMYDNLIVLEDRDINAFRDYLTDIIYREKTITVTKDSGVFICSR